MLLIKSYVSSILFELDKKILQLDLNSIKEMKFDSASKNFLFAHIWATILKHSLREKFYSIWYSTFLCISSKVFLGKNVLKSNPSIFIIYNNSISLLPSKC